MSTDNGPGWMYWIAHPIEWAKETWEEEGIWVIILIPLIPIALLYFPLFLISTRILSVFLRVAKEGQPRENLRGFLLVVALIMPVAFWIAIIKVVEALTGWEF